MTESGKLRVQGRPCVIALGNTWENDETGNGEILKRRIREDETGP